MNRYAMASAVACLLSSSTWHRTTAESLVNWETPHVHPIDKTPDGTRLLAINTPDNRLEVFDIGAGTPVPIGAIPVGLDPVSVRALSNQRAWVVNHVSDSVSVVDLETWNVVATVNTLDEPCDVVFAGAPQRAFVSCSQANTIQVFNPDDLSAAPTNIEIDAEDPRAMAVSLDGSAVYVAVFESGNRSTILGGGSATEGFFPPNVVQDPVGPYGGVNPPPNDGEDFSPPQNPANPPPPQVGLIVKKNAQGSWMDDNNGDWTDLVSGPLADRSGRPGGWDLLDHDVVIIDAATHSVSYAKGLMNLCMGIGVNPVTGQVTVVGTEATNEVRFESNLNGRFLRVTLGIVDPELAGPSLVVDLNPHLTYDVPTVPQVERNESIGDPRGIAWNAAGTRGYVAGMGSNNVIVIDAVGERLGDLDAIDVGEGPTGLVLDESHERLYVLNKFAASISVVDTTTGAELEGVPFYDPSPIAISNGRKHLYDTHVTSGLGHVACASCHPDARMDRLAWDLGDPAGEMKGFNQNCNFGSFGDIPEALGQEPCPDWHPMKGPMVTQTLQDIIGKEPHHWRGDRDGIEEFNQTFMTLQGDDELLTPQEMQQFEDFLATVSLPPNPFRGFDNSLPVELPLPGQFFTGLGGAPGDPLPNGNAPLGLNSFFEHHVMPSIAISCSYCHTTPAGLGTNMVIDITKAGGFEIVGPFPEGPNGELHHAVVFSPQAETPDISIKVPQLRNLHEKIGFDLLHTTSRAGFGFMHDGSVDSLARFLSEPFFFFEGGLDGPPEQLIPAMVALMMAFSGSDLPLELGFPLGLPGPSSRDTHAAVGTQITVDDANQNDPSTIALLNAMMGLVDTEPDGIPGPAVGLVVKGVQNGVQRGYVYTSDTLFQSDRALEVIGATELRLSSATGSELTFTVVPAGTETRIGVDRDEDGFFDRDELDEGSDPASPCSIPAGKVQGGDADVDGDVDLFDVSAFFQCAAGPSTSVSQVCRCAFDFDADSDVDFSGFGQLQLVFVGE